MLMLESSMDERACCTTLYNFDAKIKCLSAEKIVTISSLLEWQRASPSTSLSWMIHNNAFKMWDWGIAMYDLWVL